MQMRVADLDGPVHYADFGGGGRPLVMVHGLAGMSLNWMAVGPRLALRHRVLAPDLVGFGRTPPSGRPSTAASNLTLLRRFIELQGAPAVVVGNSMGGMLAAYLAATSPELVERLVLVDPACPNPRFAGLTPLAGAILMASAAPLTAARLVRRRAERLGAERLVRSTLSALCADAGSLDAHLVQAHIDLTRERMEDMPWAETALVEAARSLVRILLRPRRYYATIDKVRVPALIVQGDRDRIVLPAAVEALHRRRPDWRYEVLEGVGHLPMMEAPGRFAGLLEDWMEDAPAAAAG